jgi:hypothetical protein
MPSLADCKTDQTSNELHPTMPKSSQHPLGSTASRSGLHHRQNPLLLWRPDGGTAIRETRSSRLADFLDRDPRLGPPPARCTRLELAQILDVAMEIASGRRDPRIYAMTTTRSVSPIGAMVTSSSTPSESSADETQSHHSNNSNNAESADDDSSDEVHQAQ